MGKQITLLVQLPPGGHLDKTKRYSNICQRNLRNLVFNRAKQDPVQYGLHGVCLVDSASASPVFFLTTVRLACVRDEIAVAMATSFHEKARQKLFSELFAKGLLVWWVSGL